MTELTDKEKCQKCGAQCCKYLTFTIAELSNDRTLKHYYQTHGCIVKGNMVIVPSRCKQLGDDDLCTIYEKRPYHCKAFKGKSKNKSKKYYVPEECLL